MEISAFKDETRWYESVLNAQTSHIKAFQHNYLMNYISHFDFLKPLLLYYLIHINN
ncbi:hypothetical protein TTHERM_000112658 (macronuclear) [Tetrahymena thermophila SB210]|uniref:Uncharacterized protein n=1 Tax=Tetrahymena thermophila (strain SB210) TaxID=312017 RepID=W7XFW4_TETTS|nr:hypothetical protein TTHERM_000112658 [Tetrahymena thermophila SB210]EWS75768.1 hypothetical protein TTHERM_000112658 [Tetrahymena thermophila SB210]|eukprot:XP_012651690.1 hypothetical protein TTHERM_000112658 [Tetrahymena thermophila SB210]